MQRTTASREVDSRNKAYWGLWVVQFILESTRKYHILSVKLGGFSAFMCLLRGKYHMTCQFQNFKKIKIKNKQKKNDFDNLIEYIMKVFFLFVFLFLNCCRLPYGHTELAE